MSPHRKFRLSGKPVLGWMMRARTTAVVALGLLPILVVPSASAANWAPGREVSESASPDTFFWINLDEVREETVMVHAGSESGRRRLRMFRKVASKTTGRNPDQSGFRFPRDQKSPPELNEAFDCASGDGFVFSPLDGKKVWVITTGRRKLSKASVSEPMVFKRICGR